MCSFICLPLHLNCPFDKQLVIERITLVGDLGDKFYIFGRSSLSIWIRLLLLELIPAR